MAPIFGFKIENIKTKNVNTESIVGSNSIRMLFVYFFTKEIYRRLYRYIKLLFG
jgi:hypothetical protein